MSVERTDATRLALEKQLQYLNERMKETAETANQFLGKFLFGGLIAVIALLNADLVVLRELPVPTQNVKVLAVAAAAVLAISWLYFRTVVVHYATFRVSHRKLKYKYELTLHAILTGASSSEYATFLEEPVDRKPHQIGEDRYPEGGSFQEVAGYLLEHHRRALESREAKRWGIWRDAYLQIAIWLVVLTLVVRGSLLFY